jgi:hypothetical protein
MRWQSFAVAAALAAAAVFAWKHEALVHRVLDQRYGATLPAPNYPAPKTPAEAILQDLDYLAGLPTVDRSFSPAAKVQFERHVAALRERAGTLTFAQFLLGVAEAAAQSDNAHTNVNASIWRERLNSVPVRLAWFSDGLYVVRAMTPYAGLLGARVLAIDGFDPGVLDHELERYVGGTPEHGHAASPLLLESPQVLHAIHPEAPEDRLTLRLRDANGSERAVELPAIAPGAAPNGGRPGRLMSPVPLPKEPPGAWQTVLGSHPGFPPSLREPTRLYYATRLDGGRVLYLHLWRISNDFDPEVGNAIAAALGAPGDPPWQRIVLDLRFNDGGEYPTVYRAIKSLPQRLAADGRLMILTNHSTFSGGIITAALAKHFAGPRATIIGERAGDHLAFWAEGNAIELPNSKVRVNVSTGFHDWRNGCRELRCYWPNLVLGVAVGSIDPDVVVGWPFADYVRGVDPVLERALQR